MFTEVEVANQIEQIEELIENGKRTIQGGDLYIFITKCGTVHYDWVLIALLVEPSIMTGCCLHY